MGPGGLDLFQVGRKVLQEQLVVVLAHDLGIGSVFFEGRFEGLGERMAPEVVLGADVELLFRTILIKIGKGPATGRCGPVDSKCILVPVGNVHETVGECGEVHVDRLKLLRYLLEDLGDVAAGDPFKHVHFVLQTRLFSRPFAHGGLTLGVRLYDLDLLHLPVHKDSALGVDIMGNKSKRSPIGLSNKGVRPGEDIRYGHLNGVPGSWKCLIVRVK